MRRRASASARLARRLAILAPAAATLALAACEHDADRTAERSANGSAGADWLGYNRTLDGQRYAALDQITRSNVAQLKQVCELKLGEEGPRRA